MNDVTTKVKAQYEAYPYPARNPQDEKKRLITGSPSAIAQIRHYIFSGRLPQGKLRFLAAGGGSGDGAIMMAQQAADAGIEAEVVHLDLANATQSIARERARVRGLTNLTFVQDTLLNAGQYGPFDYIDCCGVLHHLENPQAGLNALKAALKPEGGMGLMVYAPLGRTGVYPLQSALRQLTAGIEDPAEKVKLAQKLLKELPESNWLRRNPLITDHQVSDAGLYDLLLHSTDRAYTVREFAALIRSCGLEIVSFIEKYRYNPRSYLHSPALLAHLPADPVEQAALAEELCGTTKKHIVYVAPAARALQAEIQLTPESIPVGNELDTGAVIKALRANMPLSGNLGSGGTFSLPMPRLAAAILQRINGQENWRAIYASLQQAMGSDAPTWESFWQQASELYAGLNSLNLLLLKT